MNLRPDFRKPLAIAWAVFAGVLVVCGLGLWLLADDSELQAGLESARSEQRKLLGAETKAVDLAKRVTEQEKVNRALADTIEQRKAEATLKIVAPFIVPAGTSQPGQYFNEQLAAVQDQFREIAKNRSIPWVDRLGFPAKPSVPADRDAPRLLTLLQITRKVTGIVLKTKTPIESFSLTQVRNGQPLLTGPAGRPPLLQEYQLRLGVKASLPNILEIAYKLSQRDPVDDFPLVVSYAIESNNLKPDNDIQTLDAVFDVAAMRFLSPEERIVAAKGGPVGTAAGGGGL